MDAACLARMIHQISRELDARELMRHRLGFVGSSVPERWQENDIQRHMLIAWGMCLRAHGCPVRIASQSLRLLAPESELPMVHHEEMYFLLHEDVPFGVGASGMQELLHQFRETFFPRDQVSFQLGPMEDCTDLLAAGMGRWGELFSPAFRIALSGEQAHHLQASTPPAEEDGSPRRL